MRALCVSIHDVAPATLERCRAIAAAVAELDTAVPLTLLVVPRYHGAPADPPREYREWIGERLARGDALALHGYTHSDDAPPPRGLRQRLRRSVYTAREGEFAALAHEEAAERIARGRRWFSEQGWPVSGFVAPAWLLSDGAWQAVREAGFLYTTTLTRFHVLPNNRALVAPTFVYSARGAWRRTASRAWNATLAAALAQAPVVRFGFHPADADHSELMQHALALLSRVKRKREALTKPELAHRVSDARVRSA